MIDIALLTHNKLENTIQCVNALYFHTGVPFKLTVIDDSTDLTPEYFTRLAKWKGNVNYIRPDVPIKSGNQAINIAIRETESDPFAFLINSTYVEPDWLETALEIMRDYPDVGVVGFKMVAPHSGAIIEAGGFQQDRFRIREGGHRYNVIAEVRVIGWAAEVIRRAAIPKGGFDEDYYIGFRGVDDTDNCFEITKRGWKIVYNGLGVVAHQPASSEPKIFEDGKINEEALKRREEGDENCIRFYVKWEKKISEARKEVLNGKTISNSF